MIEEKQKNNLESLSQAWSERVKTIRQMAKKGEADNVADDFIKAPLQAPAPAAAPDSELFAGAVYQDLSVQDIFVGDENFYQSMDAPRAETAAPPSYAVPQHHHHHHHKESSLVTKVLIGSLILTSLAVLSYEVLINLSSFRLGGALSNVDSQQTAPVKPEAIVVKESQELEVSLSPEQPVSLQIAQDYYRDSEYPQAYLVYKRLVQNLPETADADVMRDFLRLNMGLCLKKAEREDQSSDLFKTVSQSSSPIIRVLANYHLCLLERKQKQFLVARSRAYQAISLLDVIDYNTDWCRQLRQNCYFLAAECVSREALSLGDADQDLSEKLWPDFKAWELPFADLDEESLKPVLNSGMMQLNKALLGPKIQEEKREDAPCWTVNCNGASVGELVSRFSANSGYDVRWAMDLNRTSLRERSISVYLTGVNDRQFMTIAAGCVGLLASFDENRAVTICNPMEYSSVAEQVSVLSAEAVSCWQKYLLTFTEERYHAHAYFALGLLKAEQGLVGESLAAYKMIPGSFSNSALGPNALNSSAKLKIALHDYPGAYNDLKEAIEQYPDHDEIEETYLILADAAGRIGHDDEATKLYCKVYYLNSSRQSQSAAALAAGKMLYQGEHFADAEKWLSRYIELAEDKNDQNLYQGCIYLGKTWLALGNYQSACGALHVALSGRLTPPEYMETMTALVEGYMRQNDFAGAFGVLSETSSRQLSQADSVHILLLKSKALRGMGLTDKAILLLAEREEYIIDDLLKTQVGYELSDCYIEQGQYPQAYKKLAKILEGSDSGPEAHKIALKLTQVCLLLGLDDQALSVGSKLLSLNPSAEIEQQALELVASVYEKQKNYDRAALVLMGHWK